MYPDEPKYPAICVDDSGGVTPFSKGKRYWISEEFDYGQERKVNVYDWETKKMFGNATGWKAFRFQVGNVLVQDESQPW